MAKKNYTFQVDSEKLDAIETYLKKTGDLSYLDEELTIAVNRVYRKSVPKNVRDYLDMKAGKEPEKTTKKSEKNPTAQQNGAFYQPEQFVSQD